MKIEKLKKTIKNAMWSFGWMIFSWTIGAWDIAMWSAGSRVSFWLAIAMFILGCGHLYFLKKDWAKITAICAEINNQ